MDLSRMMISDMSLLSLKHGIMEHKAKQRPLIIAEDLESSSFEENEENCPESVDESNIDSTSSQYLTTQHKLNTCIVDSIDALGQAKNYVKSKHFNSPSKHLQKSCILNQTSLSLGKVSFSRTEAVNRQSSSRMQEAATG